VAKHGDVRLTCEAFQRACRFLEAEARPLERSLYAFRFADGASDSVHEALARFTNEDGGFGHALEPDVRTPSSSSLATALGLKILDEIGVLASDPLVRRAVDWLISTYDVSGKVWRAVARDTNDEPHAPWWHDADGSLDRTFDGFRIIPRALIVALLHRFAKPIDWLQGLTESTVRYVEQLDSLGGGGGSDLEYVVYLAQTDLLPENHKRRLIARIRATIPQVIVRNPADWSSYCITPLRAVPSPDSIGADLIAAELDANLAFLIGQQSADGAWDPTWTFDYAADMASARTEWRGILTLEALTVLQAFGRIDGGQKLPTPVAPSS